VNQDWREQIEQEAELTLAEAVVLDEEIERLEPVRDALRDLPSDELSLQWRSQLNERLAAEAKPAAPRRNVFTLWPVAVSGLAACALAVALFAPRGGSSNPVANTSRTENSVEARMVRSHQEFQNARDLGVGAPTTPVVAPPSGGFDWSTLEKGS